MADDLNIIEQAEADAQTMRDEMVRLRAVLAAIDAVHRVAVDTRDDYAWCAECDHDWPCGTHKLLHPDVPADAQLSLFNVADPIVCPMCSTHLLIRSDVPA